MPETSARRSGDFPNISSVSLPKCSTIRDAIALPIPLTAPLAKKRSTPSADPGLTDR